MKVSKPPSGSLLGRPVDFPAVKKAGTKGLHKGSRGFRELTRRVLPR